MKKKLRDAHKEAYKRGIVGGYAQWLDEHKAAHGKPSKNLPRVLDAGGPTYAEWHAESLGMFKEGRGNTPPGPNVPSPDILVYRDLYPL